MARFACMLGWGSAALALALAQRAHAGSTGSSGSGSSDSGSTDSGATDSGSTGSGSTGSGSTDGGSTDSGSTGGTTTSTGTTTTETDGGSSTTRTTTGIDDTGGCSRCDENPGTITITSPADDASVESPFTVNAEVIPTCSCNPCPCTETPPQYVQLFLDSVAVGAPCYELACAWDVNADIGTHSLYAAATFGPDDVVGTTIQVHVTNVAPGTETGITSLDGGTSPGDTTTSGTAGAGEDPPKGCGCTAPTSADSRAPWLLVLASVVRRRRTRR